MTKKTKRTCTMVWNGGSDPEQVQNLFGENGMVEKKERSDSLASNYRSMDQRRP